MSTTNSRNYNLFVTHPSRILFSCRTQSEHYSSAIWLQNLHLATHKAARQLWNHGTLAGDSLYPENRDEVSSEENGDELPSEENRDEVSSEENRDEVSSERIETGSQAITWHRAVPTKVPHGNTRTVVTVKKNSGIRHTSACCEVRIRHCELHEARHWNDVQSTML